MPRKPVKYQIVKKLKNKVEVRSSSTGRKVLATMTKDLGGVWAVVSVSLTADNNGEYYYILRRAE